MKKSNPCRTCIHSTNGKECHDPENNHWQDDIEGNKAMYSQAEIYESWYKRNMRTIQETGKAEVI